PPHPTKSPVNSFFSSFLFFLSPGCLRPCSLLLLTYKRSSLGPSSLLFASFVSVPVFYSSISTSSPDLYGFRTPADLLSIWVSFDPKEKHMKKRIDRQ